VSGARTRSVAVIGGGIAATAAAIAFRRALPDARVTQFAAEQEPEYVGAADPYIHRFHGLVGIDPRQFTERTGAVTVSETEFRLAGKALFRVVRFDEMAYYEGVALHQLWLRLTEADPGAGLPWADVARRARRADDLAGGLGVRFDAAAYLALLSDLAREIGVASEDAATDRAELASSFDLTVDALGDPAADWATTEGIPGGLAWKIGPGGDQQDIETIERAGDRVSWTTGGWRAEGRIMAEAPAAGRAIAPFDGNVLAVGRAALRAETLDGRPLSVALAGIARAIQLLPRPGASGREAAEYNRRTGIVHEFLLDWATEQWGGAGATPQTLAALRTQFARRGRIPFRDEDPVPSGQWLGWLLGSGQRPDTIDLAATALSDDQIAKVFAVFD
jgi:tryptophan halogenase